MPSQETRKFIYLESSQIPLKEVPYGAIKENLIDPTTNKPYKGIVLEGPFAELIDTPNNNKRVYDIPEYLKLLQILKKQIHSPKGVYGELEHPEKYSVNFNNVSHKILDVWWDEEKKIVYGRLILLNTPKGKIAQEIVKSGGQLAVSARAAGEEIPQSDGTYKAVTKLLTTYDLVYHPGFSAAVMEFKELNESQKFLQYASNSKKGFGIKLYPNQLNKISNAYASYINLNECTEYERLQRKSMCFLEWLGSNMSVLNEESKTQETKVDQQVMEENEPSDKQQKQAKLKKATQQQLDESDKVLQFQKDMLFKECDVYQQKLRNKADTAYFDNAAGFVDTGLDI